MHVAFRQDSSCALAASEYDAPLCAFVYQKTAGCERGQALYGRMGRFPCRSEEGAENTEKTGPAPQGKGSCEGCFHPAYVGFGKRCRDGGQHEG